MSENIPFDLQLAIMNRLPVKSLLQFRTVSKSWKYSIDCSDFVREYGFRESNNCCLYLTFKQNYEGVICLVDDNFALSPVVIDMPEEMLVEECLPPYYISQLGDCIIISDSFKFADFSIIYAWELQVDDGEVS
ncbi:F-box domain containing protein [Tanacetum coccineum]